MLLYAGETCNKNKLMTVYKGNQENNSCETLRYIWHRDNAKNVSPSKFEFLKQTIVWLSTLL
jgi:hypothetical protein